MPERAEVLPWGPRPDGSGGVTIARASLTGRGTRHLRAARGRAAWRCCSQSNTAVSAAKNVVGT
jgi:hypothetical protein